MAATAPPAEKITSIGLSNLSATIVLEFRALNEIRYSKKFIWREIMKSGEMMFYEEMGFGVVLARLEDRRTPGAGVKRVCT